MNKNVKIAKELVRLAKSLVAEDTRRTVKFMNVGNACQCLVKVGCDSVPCDVNGDYQIDAYNVFYGYLDINSHIVRMKAVFNSVKEDVERIFKNDFTILDGTKKDSNMDNGSILIVAKGFENVKKLVDLCKANGIHINFIEDKFSDMEPGSAQNIFNICCRNNGEFYETISGDRVTKEDYELAKSLNGQYKIQNGKVIAYNR